jgi:hypothetical protein
MRSWNTASLALGSLCGTVLLTLGGCGSIVDPAAEKQFKQDLGNATITVFPAAVRRAQITHDAAAAQQVANYLKDQKLADATASDAEVPLTGSWHSNESTMWKESALALAAYVKEHPINTHYAMLPEYLILGGSGAIGGVHLYVVDSNGRVVAGFGLNSHHKLFNEINPKTVADCTTLLQRQISVKFAPSDASTKE